MTHESGSLRDARLLRRGIESARQELPSEQSISRTLLVLGISSATLPASAVIAHAAARRAQWSLAAKLLGSFAVVSALGLGLWISGRAGGSHAEPSMPIVVSSAPTVEVSTAQSPDVPSAVPTAPIQELSHRVQDVMPSPAPRAAAVSAPTAARSVAELSPDNVDRLDAEVRALDLVRQALASRASAHALSLLDRYNTEFPKPVLGGEAQVLRIEALMQSGNGAGARRLAEQYLRAWPNSPLASKVRSLAGLENP